MNKRFVFVVLVVILLGLFGYFFLPRGGYQWNSLEDKAQYSDVSWNKITVSRLEGFTPRLILLENKTEPCKAFGNNKAYLRTEGGICQTGYWLEIKDRLSAKRIDSVARLKETFGPIDSEAEAASFVAVTSRDIKINVDDIVDGRTATINDGYLVQIVRNNTFGCGSHRPTGVIYKVLKSGDMEQVAFEKKPKFGFEPQMCVD